MIPHLQLVDMSSCNCGTFQMRQHQVFSGVVREIVFHRNELYVATLHHVVRVRDSLEHVHHENDIITSFAMSPDGRHNVTVTNSSVWVQSDQTNGKSMLLHAKPYVVLQYCAFSPNSDYVVVLLEFALSYMWSICMGIFTRIK